jgi:DNA glycosylase AlkZ-like
MHIAGPSATMRNRMLRSTDLNRALLARQLLLTRERRDPIDVIEHLVGLQAQEPLDPYTGLWCRIDGFDPRSLASALEDKRVVRLALQRSTIHLVTADDALALRPALQVVQERAMKGTFGQALEGVDLDRLAADGRRLVEERPRALGELGNELAKTHDGRDPVALAIAVRAGVALVQPPPRGVWAKRGRALHTSIEAWLGEPPGPAITLEGLVVRYLAAFGPASVKDAQVWCGLTRLADVVERLRPRLVTFKDENGAELFDLPDAPRPPADTPAPPRFLPQFDNVLLSHADRSRIVPEGIGERINRQFGHWSPLLVDGRLRGTWKLSRRRGAATLSIELGDKLSRAERAAVEDEGARLLEFAADGGEIRFVE